MVSPSQPSSNVGQKKTGGVASNYAIIFFGIFFFPVLFIALLFAMRRRSSGDDWEKTHYEMQFRTLVLLMIVQATMFVVGAGAIVAFPVETAADAREFRQFALFAGMVGYVAMGWAAIRLGRGLFLAGGKNALSFPRSYSVWPR